MGATGHDIGGDVKPSSPLRGAVRNAIWLLAGMALWFALAVQSRADASTADAAEGAHGLPAGAICSALIAQAESARNIPKHLLLAISLAESGRADPATGKRVPWPWTVMAEGKGRYFATKAQALAHVAALQGRGVRNIDVGCMQVNLHFHGSRFDNVAAAMDPVNNVAYATAFLTDLRRDLNSWTSAVKHYHSATPERHRIYRARVYDIWEDLRRADRAPPTRAAVAAAPKPAPARAPATAAAPAPGDDSADEPAAAVAPHAGASNGIGVWPPRGIAAQRQAEMIARVRALTPR